MKTALFAVFTLVACAPVVYGFPRGTPNGACDAVSTSLQPHGPAQIPPSPYNIAGLPSQYTPGATYNCK